MKLVDKQRRIKSDTIKSLKDKILKVLVTKEDKGYSASTKIGRNFIACEGDSFEALKSNLLAAIHFTFEGQGSQYKISQFQYEYDLESFFQFYRVINAKALSERIGMNQSLLAQYINGSKKPSDKQINRILIEIQQIGRELSEVNLINKD